MEHPSQVRKDPIDETSVFPHPSKLHIAKVVLKLLPVVISLRRDRREWVKREGKNVDEEKYRRHARKALKTFIELGPSYIKLGQWLSTRVDILPQPYLEVLAKLQDDVPPARFEEIKPIIESELGKIEDAFEEFDTAPLSGASLGQVYVAKYAGRQVIVKVGRPSIERVIEDDIYVLKKILPLATRFIDPNLRFSAEGMLAQFIETVHEEMDYRIEAQNLLTIKHNLAGDPSVVVPDLFIERTSRHVLTMEYVPGVKITDIARLNEKGIDREKLVVRAHRLFFKMLLRHNIFHADPHPGNISVTDDGRLILYDFGMVGRLDSETRIRLIRLYLGLLDKDAERTVNVLIELGTLEPTVNRYIVERGIALSIQSMHGKKVDRMEVKSLVDLANKTMSRFPFRLPKNLALYMRMASILEGIYQHHKVPFQFVKVLANLLEEEGLVRDAYIEELKISAKRFAKGIQDSVTVAPLLKTYLETMSAYGRQERNTGTLSTSILASALFVGSAVILPYNAYFSYGGFAAAAATVAFLLRKKF
ncbi:MAG TPA: AarF/ABC1/UbiB kinase family protein [Nitrososphaera sp.]|jgi:predicted unusual protein kinase regulating ubiquinone biosynthesis (AarF/ABC1/UbiB family)|nr:AarF/ABC1/UbiB kinase family protein [Nitrososphaera sp.]